MGKTVGVDPEGDAMIPWKVIATVASITAIGLVSLAVGQHLLAAAAGGALFSYLGRLNGAATTNPAS